MLSWVEYEKSFIASGLGYGRPDSTIQVCSFTCKIVWFISASDPEGSLEPPPFLSSL